MQRLLQHDTQVAAGLYFAVKSLNLAVQCGIIEIRPKYEWRKFLWQTMSYRLPAHKVNLESVLTSTTQSIMAIFMISAAVP